MSSSIYNHKHLQPTGAASQGPSQQHSQARLNDCFDTIRQEFDILSQEVVVLRTQRDDIENKVSSQVNELNIIRNSLYDLETQHGKIRQQYEDEIRALRAELHAARQQGRERETLGLASLGRDRDRDRERDRDRDRERERDLRDRDRDRDIVMGGPGMPVARSDPVGRDSLGIGRPPVGVPGAPPPGQPEALNPLHPPHPPSALGPGPGPTPYGEAFYTRAEREREREQRERAATAAAAAERGDRERDRERDGREPKRIKTERMKSDRSGDPFSPSLGPMPHPLAHPNLQSIPLGPTGPAPNGPPSAPGSSTMSGTSAASGGPNTNGPSSTNGSLSGPGANPSSGPGSTPKMPPTMPGMASLPPLPYGSGGSQPGARDAANGPSGPGQQGAPDGNAGPGQPGTNGAGGSLPFPHTPSSVAAEAPGPSGGSVDLSMDPHNVPPELKNEGSDWFAIFNSVGKDPQTGLRKRALDVNLVHTLMHESVVCCVRFSADGKFLATGCNRTAQIYDTKTGQKTCVLVDEAASKTGDLYIRSVCFSPDGKLLATGAEDKQIRIWDIAKKRIRNVFDGHQQEIYSLDFSRDGRLIVSGSGDKTARIWDMDGSTNKILTINEPDNVDAGVTSVCISPDGRLVAAGSLDTIVRIWDVQTGILVERLKGHRDSVYSVAFTPDGKGLVSGSLDKTLKYWDVRPILRGREAAGSNGGAVVQGGAGAAKNGAKDGGEKGSQCMMNFTGHKDYVLSVAVSHDGQWVVSGSKDRGVQFWDAKTAMAQCMLQGHKNSVISIDLSPAGSILATGSGDWQARIWSYTAL